MGRSQRQKGPEDMSRDARQMDREFTRWGQQDRKMVCGDCHHRWVMQGVSCRCPKCGGIKIRAV